MMPDQGQSSSNKGKTQTKAAIDNKKKLDFPLDFSFKDLGDVSGKVSCCYTSQTTSTKNDLL